MNRKTFYSIFAFFAVLTIVTAQGIKPPVKYWVKFTDKNGTPFSLSQPEQFLTAKSIERRTNYGIPFHVSDLPVTPSYINQIASVPNVRVLYASKWINGVVIVIDSANLAPAAFAAIKTFSFVVDTSKVQRFASDRTEPIMAEASPRDLQRSSESELLKYQHGGSFVQNNQLNIDCYHERGYRGQGMTIGVMDAGFGAVDSNPVFDSLRNNGGILGGRDIVSGGENIYSGGTHGTMVLSCMAANVPGVILGSAPMAKYWLFRTEAPGEYIIEEYNWIRGAEFADSVGVDILNTSLGYTDFDDPKMNHTYATLNGRTAPMSIAATMAARKGIFVLNSAGNSRATAWHYIGVPADADSICTVGAIDGHGNDVPFSSVGPTSDGRIKPDLVARGAGAWVSVNTPECFPANGTSFSSPVLAGAVACFWQANKSLNNIKLLDSLKKLGNNAASPNNFIGWGIPILPCAPAINYTCEPKAEFVYLSQKSGEVRFTSLSTKTHPHTSYTWVFGDGTSITGTATAVSHVYQNTDTAWYRAYLLVDNQLSKNCRDTSEAQTIKFEKDFNFTAFSDEETSQITVWLANTNYEHIEVDLVDLNGRILLTGSPSSTDNTTMIIDGYDLPSAYYIIRVKTSKGVKTKKIFKK